MNTRKRNQLGQYISDSGNDASVFPKESYFHITIKILCGIMVVILASPWLLIMARNDLISKIFQYILQFYYQHFMNNCQCDPKKIGNDADM